MSSAGSPESECLYQGKPEGAIRKCHRLSSKADYLEQCDKLEEAKACHQQSSQALQAYLRTQISVSARHQVELLIRRHQNRILYLKKRLEEQQGDAQGELSVSIKEAQDEHVRFYFSQNPGLLQDFKRSQVQFNNAMEQLHRLARPEDITREVKNRLLFNTDNVEPSTSTDQHSTEKCPQDFNEEPITKGALAGGSFPRSDEACCARAFKDNSGTSSEENSSLGNKSCDKNKTESRADALCSEGCHDGKSSLCSKLRSADTKFHDKIRQGLPGPEEKESGVVKCFRKEFVRENKTSEEKCILEKQCFSTCKENECTENKCSGKKCYEDKGSEDKCVGKKGFEDKCTEDKFIGKKCYEDKCSQNKCSGIVCRQCKKSLETRVTEEGLLVRLVSELPLLWRAKDRMMHAVLADYCRVAKARNELQQQTQQLTMQLERARQQLQQFSSSMHSMSDPLQETQDFSLHDTSANSSDQRRHAAALSDELLCDALERNFLGKCQQIDSNEAVSRSVRNAVNDQEMRGRNAVNDQEMRGRNAVNDQEMRGRNAVNDQEMRGRNAVNDQEMRGRNAVNDQEIRGRNVNGREIRGMHDEKKNISNGSRDTSKLTENSLLYQTKHDADEGFTNSSIRWKNEKSGHVVDDDPWLSTCGKNDRSGISLRGCDEELWFSMGAADEKLAPLKQDFDDKYGVGDGLLNTYSSHHAFAGDKSSSNVRNKPGNTTNTKEKARRDKNSGRCNTSSVAASCLDACDLPPWKSNE
ncbi:uncharacterized protein LOC108683266 isoform X2 [Hyalella azteca]|uniref:Uncharacterized protein LOC108683266 isoform X2 n=1 Tax=Hyalella azteca TaxID=294128 RepID=A0A8B7PS82_HYAAZ|nr:uncharacterized protein LOC108683266 isoform X2 [Hyalella azteca]